MRTLPFAALVSVCLAAGAAGAQQPTSPASPTMPAPGSPSAPMSGMQDSVRMAPSAGAAQGDTASLVGQVQQVIDAARAGLTSVPVATATELIASIETKLRASNRASLRAVASDLRALRSELGKPTVSGLRVGVILRRVGPKVTGVAAGQTGAVRTALRELGSQLSTAGRQLAAPAAAR